ncbi:MAG: glycosyltransferase [Nitrospirae bacterium]|nr:glycosyltransferase [Nitrospirota bacterium]
MRTRILTFNWHESYIHMLAKTGCSFDVVEKWKGGRFGWIREFRPVPDNCRLISEEEASYGLRSGVYDLIIAHNINDLVTVNDCSVPKILVFHNKLSTEIALGGYAVNREEYLESVRRLVGSAKDLTLVFISEAKMQDWGMTGEVIPPGIDITEYGGWRGDVAKVLRIGNFLMERDIMLGYSVQERLLKGLSSTILGLNPHIADAYVPKGWEELKDFMRSHRVYLNTTMHPYEDGYNLAMLEAMAVGSPVVSLANPSSPVEDGVNGYISSDEDYLRDRAAELLHDAALAGTLGQRARETVMDRFPAERFLRDWKRIIGVPCRSSIQMVDECTLGKSSGNCARRLKVLLSYTSNPQTTAFYIEKALRRNHDVITYGPAIEDEIIREWKLEQVRDRVTEHDIPYFTPDLDKVLASLPPGWVPDLFLWVESGVSFSLFGTRNLPCLSACYLIDTHLNLEKHLEIARDYDIVFLAQREYVASFERAGFERVYWLPLACDPDIHRKRNLEKIYDVGFVGSLNQQRRVDLLNAIGKHVGLYYERCFLERMAEVYSRSRIVFNNAVNNDLNMRVFEVLCSGSLLLTDEADGSGLTDLFKDRKHLVIYHDKDELVELVKYYLDNDDEREKIAAEGMKEVLQKHTYDHRVAQMVRIVTPLLDGDIDRESGKIWDSHPEALVLQPYCVGKGIDVGSGFRKTHPDAIGIDIIPKGEIGEHGCMHGMRSVADVAASGDDLYMFGDGELDYVVNRHNLEHYVDVVKTLLEWKRVLKVGGVLGMVLPDESKIDTISLDPTHKHCFTPESITRLLDLIGGFEIERIEPVVENWSFMVVARKVSDKGENMKQTSVSVDARAEGKTRKPVEGAVPGDYYSRERRDVEILVPHDVKRVLDVGCGEGVLGKRLLDRGASEVIGVEISEEACRKAARNLTGVVCGDIEDIALSFEDGYFDCIVLADVLEHLVDPMSTLKKLGKYLSDAGSIVASIPNVRYYGVINMLVEGRWRYDDYGILDRTHLRFFTKKEIYLLFEKAGFEITGITANIDPEYNSLGYGFSGNVSFGRTSLRDLSPEEVKDLFVVQYILKAEKAGSELRRLNDGVNSAMEAGDHDTAVKAYEEYLALHPADTDTLVRYAELCYRTGMLDKALESLDRILLFEPEREDAIELRRAVEKPFVDGSRS